MTTHARLEPALLQGPLAESPIVGGKVELQLITTLQCNLRCSYCSLGEGKVIGSQGRVSYTLDQLETFVETHLGGREVTVTFYGGEPTLNLDFVGAVIDRFPWFRYQLQTNGTLLQRVPEPVLARLSNVLVSVDGGEATTDAYRGPGTYARAMRGVEAVRARLGGTLTARVTWGSSRTTADEFDALLATGLFDYLYWQFATGDLYAGSSVADRQVQLRRLVERFFASTTTLFPVVPLMGIVRNLLFPERAKEICHGLAQCRVSTHLLNVMPNGAIYPCPDLMYLPEMQTGDVVGNWLRRSPLQPSPSMPCGGCEAQAWCRGNCVKDLHLSYVRGDQSLRTKVVEPVCGLLRFLGQEIARHHPRQWFAQTPLALRRQLTDAEVYDFVEIMP